MPPAYKAGRGDLEGRDRRDPRRTRRRTRPSQPLEREGETGLTRRLVFVNVTRRLGRLGHHPTGRRNSECCDCGLPHHDGCRCRDRRAARAWFSESPIEPDGGDLRGPGERHPTVHRRAGEDRRAWTGACDGRPRPRPGLVTGEPSRLDHDPSDRQAKWPDNRPNSGDGGRTRVASNTRRQQACVRLAQNGLGGRRATRQPIRTRGC